MHAIKGVLQSHAWGHAFASNGFGPTFPVREHLLERLAWQAAPAVYAELPSYPQFTSCFPARRHIPFMQLLSGVLPKSRQPAKRPAAVAAAAASDDDEPRPWSKRLRPRLGRKVFPLRSMPVPAPSAAGPPEPAAVVSPSVPCAISTHGHPLPSLRRFPSRIHRSTSALPPETSG